MKNQIRLQKDEQVVLARRYDSFLPILLIVIGGIITAFGFIFGIILMMEIEDPSPFLSALFGVILIVLGNHLKPKGEFCLIVTNKRVVQDGPFGQFVVLPLNRITAVSGNGKALIVSSAGGRITMSIPDSVSACNTISGLLNQIQEEVEVEQNGTVSQSVNNSVSQTSASMPDGWKCPSCSCVNPPYQITCVCGARKPQEKSLGWICECGTRNAERATTCRTCNASRYSGVQYKKCACGATVEKGKTCPLCGKVV